MSYRQKGRHSTTEGVPYVHPDCVKLIKDVLNAVDIVNPVWKFNISLTFHQKDTIL